MLTVTLRHDAGIPLRTSLRTLLDCWRRTRQGGAVQRIWTKRVKASMRVVEVTHSHANGWHPHVHVMIQGGRWTADEEQVLLERWVSVVTKHAGARFSPSFERGLVWSRPFAADDEGGRGRYISKVGLELTGVAKEGRYRSRSPWQIAADAGRGDRRSVELWHEYSSATKGARMLWMDERANAYADGQRAVEGVEYECETLRPPRKKTFVELWPEELSALRAAEFRHPSILHDVLASAEASEDPDAVVHEWVAWSSRRQREGWKGHGDRIGQAEGHGTGAALGGA
jgi:hypothetical protein